MSLTFEDVRDSIEDMAGQIVDDYDYMAAGKLRKSCGEIIAADPKITFATRFMAIVDILATYCHAKGVMQDDPQLSRYLLGAAHHLGMAYLANLEDRPKAHEC